jgi:hypothetical protein
VLRAGGSDTEAASVAGFRRRIQDLARRFLYFPDAQIGWYLPAVLAAHRALPCQQIDAVFSSSFPITSHLIAERVGAHLRVPWVAEFRDPWSEMLSSGSRQQLLARRLERRIAERCDRLVMTSPSWAARHSELWSRPVTVIPNGHDEDDGPRTPSLPGFTLAYLGTYYPSTQRLEAAWDAVRRLNQEAPIKVSRIRLIGDAHPKLIADLEARDLGSIVEVTGFLPHREALRAAQECSALLVAGPVQATGILKGQVAAKIGEYLGTPRPILYVGDPSSDAADLLRRYEGTFVVPTYDVDAMIAALKASAEWSGGRDATSLSRSRLTGRLAALLDEIVD